MIKKSVSLIAFATVLGAFGGAYAAAGDNTIVTSKAYVDNTKQEKIAASEWVDAYENPIPGVVISTDENGIVEQRMILDNVAQPISSNAIANLVANGNDGNGGNGTVTHDIHDNSVTATDVNASIPTTTMTIAIANAAANTAANNATATLPWATAEQNATGAYSTTFADSGTNVWPTADADKVVKGQTFANAMATKQNKIAGHAANALASVLTDTTTDGVVAKLPIMTVYENGSDFLSEWVNNDNMIPTIGAVANAIQPVPWNTREQNATATYSTTFATSGTNVWPTADAGNFVTGQTFANALAVKQNKISGYDAQNGTQSVLVDSTTDGTVQKRAIFNDTAANYDSTTQSTQIPTMGAVMSAVSAGTNAVDISSHTINGAPLSNSASYFYGVSDTGSRNATKVVRIPSITQQTDGLMIFVSFTHTDGVDDGTTRRLQLIGSDGNGNEVTFPAGDMIYRGAYLTKKELAQDVLSMRHVTMWIRKGNDWHFIGGGEPNNLLGIDDGILGTSTEENVVSAANLKQIIQGTTLTGLSTSDARAVAETDSITTGIGKLQAQITDVAGDIPTLPTGQNGNIVTYNAQGQIGGSLDPATLQTAIPAGSYGANNSLVTYDDTAGTVQERWILGEGTEEMEDNPVVGTTFYASRLRTDFSGDNFGTLADGNMTAITKTEAEESLVPAKIISKALLSKQDNIPGHAANAADSLLTDSTTTGTVQKRAIFTDGTTYVAGTHANQIPTMGAVMSAVSAGVSAAAPSGDPSTIANFDANGALGSGIATYTGATQQSPYNADNDAGKIATAAAVETKQTKKVCYGWPDGVEHTDANCWLWTLPD